MDGPEDTGDTLKNCLPETGHRTTPTMDALVPLRSVKATVAHVPFIEEARCKVTREMESMIITGLSSLVCHSMFWRESLT